MKTFITILTLFLTTLLFAQADPCQEFMVKMREAAKKKELENAKFFMKGFIACKEENIENNLIIKSLNNIEYIKGVYNNRIIAHTNLNNDILFDENFKIIISEKGFIIPYFFLKNELQDNNERQQNDYEVKFFKAKNDSINYSFFDLNGNILKNVSSIEDIRCNEINCEFYKKDNKKEYVGLLNSNLVEILKPIYYEIGYTSENMVWVRKHIRDKKGGKIGFVNIKSGEEIPFIYDKYDNRFNGRFIHGLVPVNKNGKYGYIDKKNSTVISFKFKEAYPFSRTSKLACVKMFDKYGFIDLKGNEVIPISYDYASSFYNGLACVEIKNKYGYINEKGELIIPSIYDNISNFRIDNDLYYPTALVTKNGQRFYINTKGQCVKDCYNAPANHTRANN